MVTNMSRPGKARQSRLRVAIIGAGNIGTDLMTNVMRLSKVQEKGAMIGSGPASVGLARTRRLGLPVSETGVEGFAPCPFRKIWRWHSMLPVRVRIGATTGCWRAALSE